MVLVCTVIRIHSSPRSEIKSMPSVISKVPSILSSASTPEPGSTDPTSEFPLVVEQSPQMVVLHQLIPLTT